ncbi:MULTISPECIES: YafY family protein [unclassified Nocardia]|uniref:helix-turn-helix transcriptional regulator n=1 Tax=unclassified Nocardia TaxID=2637762 RepID=UPI001CE40038|nr:MULTISPECIES: WYL domain-containing protein [unclassified Nocardia]
MTRPTARVLALLEILQTGGIHTVGQLSARLGVDERTVRRYITHLTDLDIPVLSMRGRYGGYRLAPGYRMPPLMLSDDEALAVLLGLLAGRRAGWSTAAVHAADSAAAKLRRILPETLAARLETLLRTVEFTTEPRPGTTPEIGILLLLAEATRDRRPVAITHLGRDGRRGDRTVHPYGIVAHAGRWYVTGADSTSGETRSFRLDRITTATALPGTFTPPDEFEPAAHLLSALARMPYRHEVSVRVQGTAAQIRPLLPAAIAIVEQIPTGTAQIDFDPWVRVRIRAERLDWIPALLAGLDRRIIVEYPEALNDSLRALARRLLADTGGQPEPNE